MVEELTAARKMNESLPLLPATSEAEAMPTMLMIKASTALSVEAQLVSHVEGVIATVALNEGGETSAAM